MPFALVTIGLLMVISGVKNTQAQLAGQLRQDFSGDGNFFYWLAGLGAIGALGYVPAMRSFSRVLLALVIVVLALHNQGFFSQFTSALQSIQDPGPSTQPDPTTGGDPSSTSSTVGSAVGSSVGSSVGSAAGPIGSWLGGKIGGGLGGLF